MYFGTSHQFCQTVKRRSTWEEWKASFTLKNCVWLVKDVFFSIADVMPVKQICQGLKICLMDIGDLATYKTIQIV